MKRLVHRKVTVTIDGENFEGHMRFDHETNSVVIGDHKTNEPIKTVTLDEWKNLSPVEVEVYERYAESKKVVDYDFVKGNVQDVV